MQKKKIYIMLTKFFTRSAKFYEKLKGHYYTHSSIGLEEDMNTFYSFVNKGLIVESISRYAKKGDQSLPCQLFELEVSEKAYNIIRNAQERFVQKKEQLKYSQWGVVLGLLYIPHKIKDKYFCSQFVAEVLKESKKIKIYRFASTCFPEDFKKLKV